MFEEFKWLPDQASTVAPEVDMLMLFIVVVTVVITVVVAALTLGFAIAFRRKSESYIPAPWFGCIPLEIGWTLIPVGICLVMFSWGVKVYSNIVIPPADAMELYAVGRQWMWKIQHPEGQREINALHVPIGRPVKVTLTSVDVIH